jgi:demethylmenaquinone methyltransferase/2-methoxy-6-polyprenyl-1,4-benzoquinol methylase
LVSEVFSSVASKYDIMNDIMSLGIHRLWKKRLLQEITDPNGKILDMASGTGDIAIKLYEKFLNESKKKVDITACDPSEEMLCIARKKL